MPVISAIDVGSNAIRMAIASVENKKVPRKLCYCREAIRLGQDVFSTGVISPQTIQRSIEAFKKFRSLIDQHHVDRIRALGTSALRESHNRLDMINEISAASGIEVRPIDGDEEARLIRRAVDSRVNLKNKNAILVDMGGGSAEVIILEDGQVSTTNSFRMGSVRLLQMFGNQNQDMTSFASLVRDYLEPTRRFIKTKIRRRKFDLCVGTGGSVEVLGELRKQLLGKRSDEFLYTKEVKQILAELQSTGYEDRVINMKLRPDRADVILPAAVVLDFLLKQFGLSKLMIPRVSIKDGILIELAEEIAGTNYVHLHDQILQSVRVIGRKYDFDEKHAETVAAFAEQLFDATKDLHGLNNDDRLLLSVTAWLHDIGQFINITDHHKHSLYIINASPIVGLTQMQKKIVANVARYHNKSFPKLRHENYISLSEGDRERVKKLSAILRLADAIDFEHVGRVDNMVVSTTKDSLILDLNSSKELSLTKWAVRKQSVLFQEVFNRDVQVGKLLT
ncbi:MAG TPA: Ppx/GppA phosphatase family protein [Syntrophales bacterium]|nr:Ppx/GppA phosphatase family protein [Syntrophales bacterium]